MSTVGWLDVSSGASGDMLLGALVGVGVPVEAIAAAVDRVAPEPVGLRVETVTRAGLTATRCHVDVDDSDTYRTWRDVRALLDEAGLDPRVHQGATAVFARLAEAEATAHGVSVDEVHFHEVGALDAIADVVGVVAGFTHLGLDRLVCSPVAVGGGSVTSAHGRMPVPVPAVVELLRGLPAYGGPVDLELTTPTGAALLAVLADDFGPQPPMRTARSGSGAGARDPEGHPNLARLLLGDAADPEPDHGALVIEANIDDLDPRLWPDVIARLLEAGASDAWLTPILMKKGRPAHTLHVLVAPERAEVVRREIFRQTSTIGVREQRFAKHALDREFLQVEVAGHAIAVKIARLDGEILNVQPEYADVAAAADASGRPVKDVLAEAAGAARRVLGWI